MSILLFIIGAVAVMLGVGMIAYGIPISEFSFGNTMIVAGITMVSGGLIIIGLGAAVGQLRRIAEALATRNAIAEAHAFEPPLEAPVANAPTANIPFPPKLRSEQRAEPVLSKPPAPLVEAEEPTAPPTAPSLRNPEAPPPAPDEEVSLSPPPRQNGGGAARHEPGWEPPRETPTSRFDAMWPEPEPPRAETKPEPAPEPEAAEPAQPEKRDVAILKSGVVDGMAYTLYVDGSIEAELPQGTLHFASIEELRGHLEKNSSS